MMVAEVLQGSGQLSGRIARPGHARGNYLGSSDAGNHHCLVWTQTVCTLGKSCHSCHLAAAGVN